MGIQIFIIVALALSLLFLGWQILRLKSEAKGREELINTFKVLSHEALSQNNREFLELAKMQFEGLREKASHDLEKREEKINSLVQPMKESLSKLGENLQSYDKERKGQHESLLNQLKNLAESERHLRAETMTLSRALRAPNTRGRWGELQLKRVVELAGMVNHCDFYEQVRMGSEERGMRPDMVVHLPGERFVVIDSKVPLEYYLEAMEIEDETKRGPKLLEHARSLKAHIVQLGKKGYFEGIDNTPEFVVLFLPSDTFFSAALEIDPTLIELGIKNGVILTTPTTLIGLLKSVAYGWKQEALSQNAQKISELGHELHKRLSDLTTHFAKLGRSLTSSVESFNKAMGSYESRVLVSARKLSEMGAGSHHVSLDPLEQIDRMAKVVSEEA